MSPTDYLEGERPEDAPAPDRPTQDPIVKPFDTEAIEEGDAEGG